MGGEASQAMPRHTRPTVELFRPESWQAEVAVSIKEVVPSRAISFLKTFPGEKMYPDTMCYMEQAYKHAGDHFSSDIPEKLIQAVTSRFAYFRSYHGCRPLSLDSYFRDGLLILTRERLAQIAYEIFDKTIPFEDILRRAQTADLQTRLGNVYFTAEAEELVSECGHYLIYGSEALNCLWDDGNGRTLPLFRECQERHRRKGIPTVFECDVPIAWLPVAFRRELANTLVTRHLQLKSEQPVPMESWSRNWGHYISRNLPARYIRSHFHPQVIPDPLRQMITYQNPHTRCAWCNIKPELPR